MKIVIFPHLTEYNSIYRVSIVNDQNHYTTDISVFKDRRNDATINWPGCGEKTIEFTQVFTEAMGIALRIAALLNDGTGRFPTIVDGKWIE